MAGLLSLGVPQVLGNGYETMNSALYAQIGLGTLLLVFPAKLMATGATLQGLGLLAGAFSRPSSWAPCWEGPLGPRCTSCFP